MPRALAIETSGRIGSIATILDGRILAEEQFPHGLQHAAQIIPIIDRLCRVQNWQPKDIDELYISIGPGSFTGLRIAVTLGKMMALASGVKIVAVPTVQVLALNAPNGATNLIIVLDAKRDQIFTARFQHSPSPGTPGECWGEGLNWIESEPAHLDDLPAMLARSPRPVHLLGEGIPYHQKFIPTNDNSAIVTTEDRWRARASAVAEIGFRLAREGHFADPLGLKPIYIRVPEAEEKWGIQ